MSGFKNHQFVREFAYRTKANYYLLKEQILHPHEVYSPELKMVIRDMEGYGFDISLQYEVTLALNSMIGLLVFPEQAYFHEQRLNNSFLRLTVLQKYMNDPINYKNTYKKHINNEDTPLAIIKHMRNAIAHENIMIVPESAEYGKITYVQFRDVAEYTNGKLRPVGKKEGETLDSQIYKIKKNHKCVCEFSLRVDVNDLERLLMEISDFLIHE